jgi:two-component system, OmpR family, response regulator
VCEDDAELRSVLTRALEGAGFDVSAVASGHEAVELFTRTLPDVLVLDIGLPDSDGRDVCQALRARGVSAPVIFLTALGTLSDRLTGFNVGGDDYLTKPFALAELVVRIEALLRRAESRPEPGARELHLDPASHSVRLGGRNEPLTPTEFRLLAALAARPGEVVRRRALVAAAWPDGAIVHDNTLDTYIARLRRKLRALGSSQGIETARRVGYVLR